jgi:hypothetical protein
MGKIVVAVSLALAFTSGLFAQPNARAVTGTAAVRTFTFHGTPIHPFCVDFPLERSSRSQPNELTKCTDPRVPPKSAPGGWLSAEYPTEPGERFVSFPPYASYRVLARKGDRFFITTEKSGGGSGQFTELFWVRLGTDRIALVKDETGGDRCLGGLDITKVSGTSVRLSQSRSAQDLIALSSVSASVSAPATLTDQLHSGYQACDGSAAYRYDLNSERMQLTGVLLSQPDPPDAADTSPQACFDRLAIQYGNRGPLAPDQLKRFGQEFVAMCGRTR